MEIKPKKTFVFAIQQDPELARHLNWGGWGNGYVAIMPGHPLYQMDYNDIQTDYFIDVNGGLTYSGYAKGLKLENKNIPDTAWVIGFDTMHSHDTREMWPDEASVLNEAKKLEKQINEIIFIPK